MYNICVGTTMLTLDEIDSISITRIAGDVYKATFSGDLAVTFDGLDGFQITEEWVVRDVTVVAGAIDKHWDDDERSDVEAYDRYKSESHNDGKCFCCKCNGHCSPECVANQETGCVAGYPDLSDNDEGLDPDDLDYEMGVGESEFDDERPYLSCGQYMAGKCPCSRDHCSNECMDDMTTGCMAPEPEDEHIDTRTFYRGRFKEDPVEFDEEYILSWDQGNDYTVVVKCVLYDENGRIVATELDDGRVCLLDDIHEDEPDIDKRGCSGWVWEDTGFFMTPFFETIYCKDCPNNTECAFADSDYDWDLPRETKRFYNGPLCTCVGCSDGTIKVVPDDPCVNDTEKKVEPKKPERPDYSELIANIGRACVDALEALRERTYGKREDMCLDEDK